jgi:hypothetical protein
MTLLQTRVEDQIARQFERAARKRGETPYSFLQKVVRAAAAAPDPDTWDQHWKKMKSMNLNPARKTVAELRAESGER